MKDFDDWNELKKKLDDKPFDHYVHEREVWWCSLGTNIGHEVDGKNKKFERPVLIVRVFSKDTCLVAPFSSRQDVHKYNIPIFIKGIPHSVKVSQLRVVSTWRFSNRVCKINSKSFEEVTLKIKSLI